MGQAWLARGASISGAWTVVVSLGCVPVGDCSYSFAGCRCLLQLNAPNDSYQALASVLQQQVCPAMASPGRPTYLPMPGGLHEAPPHALATPPNCVLELAWFACTCANEDVKTCFGMAWYGFPCDPPGRDDYANVRLVAPQGFSLGSHVILDGLESHTARELKQAVGLESSRAVFPVFLHNGSLNSFLCNYSVRALESCGYLSVVGQLPGHVLLRSWLTLVATRLQHSTHSPKKKKKDTNLERPGQHEVPVTSA